MKKYFLLLFLVIFNFGCEKVIEIDLNFNEENYVIDAKINNAKIKIDSTKLNKHVNSDKAFSEVRISKSRPYFSDLIEYVNDANVKLIEKQTGNEYMLNHFDEGFYSINSIDIVPESEYELVINHGNKQFISI